MMKPDNFSGYAKAGGGYVKDDVDPIYRGPVLYKVNVRWKENKSSLVYASDCQMFVVD